MPSSQLPQLFPTLLRPRTVFEESFSDDASKTLEVSWIATDTRIEEKDKSN